MCILRNIKSANGVVIGNCEISNEKIIIRNESKPELIIVDPNLINSILLNDHSKIIDLYDNYTLTIGEIASLYNCNYHRIWNELQEIPIKSAEKQGRRNSSYGKKFNNERIKNMSDSIKISRKINPVPIYERTPEIKQKISMTLKAKYASGELVQDPKMKSNAWKRGCYKNVKMGRGIQGFFYSYKSNSDIYFRSLLELWYLLILEIDPLMFKYQSEPFCISLEDGSSYTPDFLVNDTYLIELKPKDHLNYTSKERFEKEMRGLEKFSIDNNYIPFVIYDTDINFKTSEMKKYLKLHPEIIEKFNIRFKNFNLK